MKANTGSEDLEDQIMFGVSENMNTHLQTQQQLVNLANAMPQLVWIANNEAQVLYYNDRIRDYDGVFQQADGIWNWDRLFHPDDLGTALQAWNKAVQTGTTFEAEIRALMKDGSYRWHLSRAYPQKDDEGNILIWYGTATDIHHQKSNQEALYYRKALLEAQNEAIPDAILVVDTKGKMLSFNRHFGKLWRLPQEIIDAKDDRAALEFAMTQVKDPKAFIEKVQYYYAHADEASHEEVHFTDGRIIERFGNAVIGDGGIRYGWIWYFRDVTEQRQIQKAIQASEDRYQNFIQQSTEGIWRFELKVPVSIQLSVQEQLQHFYEYAYLAECNNAMAKMYGYEKAEELVGKEIKDFFPVDNDTEAYFIHFVQSGYRVENAESKELDKHGELKYFSNNLIGIVENGLLTRAWGTQRDITSQRIAEEKLRERENRYRTIFESTPLSIWEQDFSVVRKEVLQLKNDGVTDIRKYFTERPEEMQKLLPQVVIKDINQATLKLLEASSKEEVKRGLHQVFVSDTSEAFLKELAIISDGGGHFEYETILQTLKGKRFETLVHIDFPIDADYSSIMVTLVDISERVKAERQIKESEERFRSIANDAPAFIFMANTNAEIEYINDTWIRFTGLPREEALGHGWATITHPDDLQRSFDIYNHGFQTRTSYQYEMQQRGADGEYHWIFWQGIPRFLPNGDFLGMLGFGYDVTERKRSEEAVKESEDLFRSFSNNIQNLAWVANSEGWINWYNQRWYDYTGTSLEEMQGWGWEKVHHPDHIERVVSFVKEAWKKDEPFELTFPLRRHDGIYQWFLTRAVPIKDAEGKIIRWIGTNTNIHEQKILSEKLEELVYERTKELQRSNEDLEQFAHVASHDLKEPVRKIKTFSNRFKQEFENELPERAAIYLDKIEKSSERLFAMIEGMLRYSSVDMTDDLNSPVEVKQIVQNIQEDLEIVIQEKRATITVGPLPVIKGSSIQINQLFYNLINNALKFAKPDVPPQITIEAKRLNERESSAYGKSKKMVQLTVTDNGIGFEQDQSERIFKTFTRLNSKEKYEGTGLGLALCKKIVERHGGRIQATSQPGEGSVFTLLLPEA